MLGEEFSRLPKRMQTGYTITFWNHSNIIRHNQHDRESHSFAMSADEVTRNFTDPKDFRKVNDTGYSLRSFRTKHGAVADKNILCKETTGGAITYPPTNWLIKTIEAFPGRPNVGLKGCLNGYQLSSKVQNLIDNWFVRPELDECELKGMVNCNGESALEIADYYGGAIQRDRSAILTSNNIDVLIQIDIKALKRHKMQLLHILSSLAKREVDALLFDSAQWHAIACDLFNLDNMYIEGAAEEETGEALGGVKVKDRLSRPLETLMGKDFDREGVQQRVFEINRLLATAREATSPVVPVFYREVRTGRYTSQCAILQGYHKSVRYAALSGYYEYDIEAAHQNLLVQLLDKEKIDFPELAFVREYISNKALIRQNLAEELQTTVRIIKEILQTLTYGAQLTSNSRQAIYKACEGDTDLISRVITHPWLTSLANTFLIAHKYLVGDVTTINNAVGIEREIKEKAKGMAHILQGYERLVLDVLIANSEPNDVALLVHDCVVYYTPKEPEQLSAIVEKETGFKLQFSEERY